MLASAFTVLPFVAFLLTDNPQGFRLIALPGGLALGVVPLLVHFAIPESPRWFLRRGQPQAAVNAVNLMIRRCGSRVPAMTVGQLGPNLALGREELPPFMALFRAGQLRWTLVGILCSVSASSAYYTCAILLPKALVDQGGAVALSFGLASVLFMASIPGKLFTGYLMEIIGRRWTMTYSLAGSLPGIALMAGAHWMGALAPVVFIAGGLITGFTVLSAFPCTRVYLSEQFPTALRGRGHFFGEIIVATDGRRAVSAVHGASYGLSGRVLRHAVVCGRDWRVSAAADRPRDGWPSGDGDRGGARGGVIRPVAMGAAALCRKRARGNWLGR